MTTNRFSDNITVAKGLIFLDGQCILPNGVQAYMAGHSQSRVQVDIKLAPSPDHSANEISLDPREPGDLRIIKQLLQMPLYVDRVRQETADLLLADVVPMIRDVNLDTVCTLRAVANPSIVRAHVGDPRPGAPLAVAHA